MKEHVNFYEDLPEATKRLTGTVVKYDGDFYYVLLISNHKADGIFRIYLDPIKVMESHNSPGFPFLGGSGSGEAMDIYLDTKKGSKILRKMMNSPLFEKFKPFPLGMGNVDGVTIFTERSPTRHTQQGLTSQMISSIKLDLLENRRWGCEITSPFMYPIYHGIYPSYDECVSNMFDPTCVNKSAAFSRTMALMRGPCETLFLNYRGEIVGQILDKTGETVRLGSRFRFTKEIVQESGFFNNVITE